MAIPGDLERLYNRSKYMGARIKFKGLLGFSGRFSEKLS
jgi:hypothetical protein